MKIVLRLLYSGIITLTIVAVVMVSCTENLRPKSYDPVKFDDNGKIDIIPQLQLDSSAELLAIAHGSHNITFTWYFIDTLNQLHTLKLEKNEGMNSRSVTTRFSIDSLTRNNFGTYFCIAFNDNIHFNTDKEDEPEQKFTSYDTTQFFIIHQPVFTASDTLLTKGTPVHDSSFTFYCSNVHGSEPLRYIWIRDTAVIDSLSRDTLRFKKLIREHSGVYRCIVRNSLGTDTSVSCTLKVWKQPSVISIDPQGQPLIDQPFQLECRFTGTTPAVCSWYKENIVISTQNITDSSGQDTLTAALVFPSLADTNAGQYWCIIANEAARDTSGRYKVRVYHKPTIQHITPDDKMFVDSSFALTVQVIGSSPMNFLWFRDDQPIGNDTIVTTEDLGTFTKVFIIPSVKKSDAGVYSCVARNAWGSDSASSDTIKAENRAPHWNKDTIYVTVTENAHLVIDCKKHCTDPDHDPLSFTFTHPDQAPATDTITSEGIYTYAPGFSDSGTYDIALQASDGNLTAAVIMNLTVKNKNFIPEFVVDSPSTQYTIQEGDSLKIYFRATDKDSDNISYTLPNITLPEPAPFFDPVVRKIFWQAGPNDGGDYSLTIVASDGIDQVQAPVAITITKRNFAPVISIAPYHNNQTIRITEMKKLQFTVSITDLDNEDTPVFLEPLNVPPAPDAWFDKVSGKFEYIPPYSVSSKDENKTFENVTFRATDGTNDAAFTLHIQVIDTTPILLPEDVYDSLDEEEAREINLHAQSVNSDKLFWKITKAPRHGTITQLNNPIHHTNAELSYTANNCLKRTIDTVKVDISDGTETATASITLIINADNDPPIITTVAIDTITEDDPHGEVFDIDAADPENQPLTWLIKKKGTKGAISIVQNGVDSLDEGMYIPFHDSSGSDEFEIIVSDGENSSAPYSVPVVIIPENDPPIISIDSLNSNDTVRIVEMKKLQFTVRVTDPDNGDTLVLFTPDSMPPTAVFDTISGIFEYTPSFSVSTKQKNTTFSNVTFRATDGILETSFVIHVTVLDSNQPPVVKNISEDVEEEKTKEIDLEASDADGDILQWKIVKQPKFGTVSISSGTVHPQNKEFTYTAKNCAHDTIDTVKVSVSDNIDADTALIIVTITADNDPPAIQKVTIRTVTEDDPDGEIFNIEAVDPENQPLTWKLKKEPAKGKIDVLNSSVGNQAEGVYIPLPDSNGSDEFVITVSDGQKTSAQFTVAVQITPVNDKPQISIISPKNGQHIPCAEKIPIKVQFNDPEGWKKVQFFIDGVEKYSYTGKETSYTFNWKPQIDLSTIGTHTVTVKITDSIDQTVSAQATVDIAGSFYSDTCAIRMILDSNDLTLEMDFNIIDITNGRVDNLKLINRYLKNLPSIIANLTALKSLGLFNNQIKNIPQSIGNLTALKSLDLSHNQIKNIPQSIGNLTALQFLYLFNNQISNIPQSIGNLTALKSLYLYNNQIKNIPQSIGNLTALQSLILHSNTSLDTIPSEIYTISGLRRLYLDSCSITAGGLSISSTNNLKITSINIDHNKINPSKLTPGVAHWLDSVNVTKEKWRETQTP